MKSLDQGRYAVSGAAGYIGGRIRERIQKEKLLAFDKDLGESKGVMKIDLRDGGELTKAIEWFSPDFFIHAGTNSAKAYQGDFAGSFGEDYEGLRNLISALKKLPTCRLIYFSSSYVYSGLGSEAPVEEETPLLPSHPFGAAKEFFERYLEFDYPDSIIFRLSSVFGKGRAKYPNAVNMMVEECRASGEVSVWGKGNREMQYVYLPEVVKAVLEAPHLAAGVYNLGGESYVATKQAAEDIADKLDGRVRFLKEKPEGDSLPFMSTAKLKNAGIANKRWEESLELFIADEAKERGQK